MLEKRAARIVILGGGFAGIATAAKLERLLRPGEAEIDLVSRENFTLFTPMLPEVSSGGLASRHVLTPIRAQLHRTNFHLAEVRRVDLAARMVYVEHAILGKRERLQYDHLVLALGAVTSTFGLPGVAERVLPLKTIEDAARLRNHVIAMLEIADVTRDERERERLLTFVFVGGGFTGVEAAGEMVDLFNSVARFYRNVSRERIRVVLVEGGARLLPELPEGMGTYSDRELRRRGVEMVMGDLVAGADANGLLLKSGRVIPSATIVWSAGARPAPLLGKLGLPLARGGSIATKSDLAIDGRPNLWAIGDCASIPDEHGKPYPPTAQHALREGPRLAENIVRTLRGKPTQAFRYRAMGMMASLGARRGVASLRGKVLLTGFPAFFLWRSYYLLRLPGIDRRIRVAFDWTLNLLFPRDIAELRVYTRSAREDLSSMPSAEISTSDI
ncbi:MAG TPA: NAD(P)/FAD-dependent oxidoreductase [Candidatus Baltobacteraceae bacterium]|jgi:NADH dehydrogenase|nr:NAD(P)/FAD-dependent oxidoreductase [Candidatus Baltobacteraceae bacterium]